MGAGYFSFVFGKVTALTQAVLASNDPRPAYWLVIDSPSLPSRALRSRLRYTW
jgi:hypothetical protein